MRLKDADRLIAEMTEAIKQGYGNEDMVDIVIEAPDVDAVEVVRCKDCKYLFADDDDYCCELYEFVCRQEDDYCSWGERREDE